MRNFQINFITNTATIRWLKILMAFEKNYQCSTQGLAKISGSTTRTIVTDVTDLKEYFGDCLSIDSSHKGYIFSIKQSAVYLTKKRALIADEILFHIIESIFHNDLYSSSELAEKYHISESTVLRYLRKVQPIFSFYRLEIQTNPICFLGEEINIRKFFHDFYYESEITAIRSFHRSPSKISLLVLFQDVINSTSMLVHLVNSIITCISPLSAILQVKVSSCLSK
ncbi:helix-turn-helix domain-containing protein [Enterococcus casseliflavus]|uniref:helix-turn-helix domain-containing protein n=1 Tax=Enterococcus casseliflavus TaxID=37734 RepID=UPI001E2D6C63|nr:helix-turn-helix domain-containing protein [Enterococcus casseliflavus]